MKRMTWPEILEHPFVVGHVTILPEDVQSESPFTKPLTYSQQEAKQLQREKISSSTRYGKLIEFIECSLFLLDINSLLHYNSYSK